jgi:hypothetical protein
MVNNRTRLSHKSRIVTRQIAKCAEAARFPDVCVFKEIIQPWLLLRKYVDNNSRQYVNDTKRHIYSKFH